MSWTLDPGLYRCPEHGVDLTAEVRKEALADGTTVVTGGGGMQGEDAPPVDVPEYSPAGPFLVVVTCPGRTAAEGEEPKPHEQPFEGLVR
ncbi:hypothetical protein ACVW00_000683 [Marmoricola sp. URHA0025 HA25]